MMRLGLVGIAAILPACALLSEAHMMDRKVAWFEKKQPDGEALGRDDLASTQRILGSMDQWKEHLDNDADLTPVERAKLIDRLDAAQVHFTIAAAQVAAPTTAFALARPLLSKDRTLLPLIRRAVDGVAADRQRRFAKSHTYFYDPDGGSAWAKTYESISYVRGRVTNQYERHDLVATPGRCVLGTQPFGPEGTPNPTLTFHVVGAAPRLFGRCYLRQVPGSDGHMKVTVGGATARVTDDRGLREKVPHFDFAVDQTRDGHIVDPDRPFGDLEISVDYTYYDGVVIGIDRDGDLRPADRYKVAHLAAGRVFWDRDGDATAATTRR